MVRGTFSPVRAWHPTVGPASPPTLGVTNTMFVFEIVTPGTWLQLADNEAAHRVENLLRNLKSQFFEANTALNLFHTERSRSNSPFRPDHDAVYERRREIERELGADRWPMPSFEERGEISFQAEVMAKREYWATGKLPRALESSVIFLYARAFLYALDAFDKFVGALCAEPGIPTAILSLKDKIGTEFPDLRGVRNSAHHLEDRARGLGTGGKPIDLKPVNNVLASGDNVRLLAMNCLLGNKYGATMADGHYGEIDVSPESLQKLQTILQAILEAFNWSGSKQHEPSL